MITGSCFQSNFFVPSKSTYNYLNCSFSGQKNIMKRGEYVAEGTLIIMMFMIFLN